MMNSRLNHLLEEYADLERGVQGLISAQCRETCELCTARCCRADICEEALDSPFLQTLHGHTELESDRCGFLTEYGCSLEIGRPPVCYEFFCEEILESQPDELHRDVLRILGRLPAFAGEQAHGKTHLVEIMQEDRLEKLNFQTLEKRLHQSFRMLEIIRTFYIEGTLPEDACKTLRQIPVSAGA
ncbi:MAG: hypothetical protein MUC65_01150 [Pontiellaceae bacterium]|jgi:hypothetical protein|nr:hypothetical protein [Pontiellaceae bacterium]